MGIGEATGSRCSRGGFSKGGVWPDEGGDNEGRQSVSGCLFRGRWVCAVFCVYCVSVPQPQNKAAGVQGGVVWDRRQKVGKQLVQREEGGGGNRGNG